MSNVLLSLTVVTAIAVCVLSLVPLSNAQSLPNTNLNSSQVSDLLAMMGSKNSTSSIVIDSSVANVTVNRFDISSPKSLEVGLNYAGSGKSPAVKVDYDAIIINTGDAESLVNEINLLNSSSPDSNSSIRSQNTTLNNILNLKLDQLDRTLSNSNGTATLDSGWKSPRTVTIDLDGKINLNDAMFLGLTVHS